MQAETRASRRWASLLTTVLVLAAGVASAQPASLRQLDWAAVLAADPLVATFPDVPSPSYCPCGPSTYIVIPPDAAIPAGPGEIPAIRDDARVFGHALTENIDYGDLDGDGVEEAVIPVACGCPNLYTGLLVYRADGARPRLAAALSGYKLNPRMENGMLTVSEQLFTIPAGSCCPQAERTTAYVLGGDTLTAVTEEVSPFREAQPLTVDHFYSLLGSRRYTEAYAFLSPAFQAATPFAAWVDGFATTERIIAASRPGPAEGQVLVELIVEDRRASSELTTRRYVGSWFLVWGESARHWLLDRAEIAEVP